MLTIELCAAEIRVAVGGELAHETSVAAIVDRAGTWLCSKGWKWLEGTTTFSTTAALPYVNLSGLDSLLRIYRVATNGGDGYFGAREIEPSDLAGVQLLQSQSTGSWSLNKWALQWFSLADGTFEPRLYLGPIPNSVQTIYVHYGNGWRSVRFGNDQNRIPIPPWMEPLFLEVLRVFALGFEEADQATTTLRLEELTRGVMYQDALATDGASQMNLGPLSMRETYSNRTYDSGLRMPQSFIS